MINAVFSPEARQDLSDILAFIAKDNQVAADEVLDDVFATLTVLAANPKAGIPRDFKNRTLAKIYSCILRRFHSYIIFYRIRQGNLEVVRLLHGARDIDALFDE